MDYAIARQNMIDCQIRVNKVSDPEVIEALEAVPRELFVPKALQARAYVDEDLPVSDARFLMEPAIIARLLQEAEANEDDVALVVGSGAGYTMALLAHLAGTVVGVESNADLVASSSNILTELGLDNALVAKGDVSKGYAKQAPYDLIIVDGAVADIPKTLCNQLAEDGRLLAVEKSEGVGRATVVLRRDDAFGHRGFFDANIPFLPEFAPQETFVF